MKLKAQNLTHDTYKQWDAFCQESARAWFWHTTYWMDYILAYRVELEAKQLSFLVYGKSKLLAIVPLVLEKHDTRYEFSFGGFSIPAPALDNQLTQAERSEVYEYIFDHIDQMAHQYNVARGQFRLTPLAKSSLEKSDHYNILMKYGYLDISLNTLLIDLKKSKEELWNDLRRNHKRNINKTERFHIPIYTSHNITKEIFDQYKEMHHRAAGRKTRPDKTFEMMYNWIAQGYAFLAAIEYERKNIGFEYYSVYKNVVYGSSAANDPDFAHLPLRHKLEWEAILFMKKQGFEIYEIGLQQYGATLFDFPDKKKRDISHFKKGYGGFTVPWFMGEKFYDKEYFLKVYNERIKKYAQEKF